MPSHASRITKPRRLPPHPEERPVATLQPAPGIDPGGLADLRRQMATLRERVGTLEHYLGKTQDHVNNLMGHHASLVALVYEEKRLRIVRENDEQLRRIDREHAAAAHHPVSDIRERLRLVQAPLRPERRAGVESI